MNVSKLKTKKSEVVDLGKDCVVHSLDEKRKEKKELDTVALKAKELKETSDKISGLIYDSLETTSLKPRHIVAILAKIIRGLINMSFVGPDIRKNNEKRKDLQKYVADIVLEPIGSSSVKKDV